MSYASQSTSNYPVVEFSRVINLALHHVGLYDSAGNIAICDPGCHANLFSDLDPSTMVIVGNEADVKAYDVPESNAVMVDGPHQGIGRNGLLISRLIRISDQAHVLLRAPSVPTPDVYHV